MRSSFKALGSLGGFGLAPLLVSLASIASIPILTSTLGTSVWLSIAVGQAMGDLARAFVLWGWNSVGLTMIASLSPNERIQYYVNSITPRLILLVPALVVVFALSLFWPTADSDALFWNAAAGAVVGMSGTWIFIGSREPLNLLFFNSLPRGLSVLVGALATMLWASGSLFGVICLLGNIVAAVGPAVVIFRRARKNGMLVRWPSVQVCIRELKAGFSGFTISFVMSARLGLPVIVTPLIAPAAGPAIALSEKIIRWANTGMTPLMQFIQTGVPRGEGSLSHRIKRSTVLTVSIAVVVGLGVGAFIPMGSKLISNGTLHLDWKMGALIGLAVMMIFVSSVTGNGSLVLLGKVGSVARFAVAGLVVMLVLMPPLATIWGATGSLMAFAFAEIVIAAILMSMLGKSLRSLRVED